MPSFKTYLFGNVHVTVDLDDAGRIEETSYNGGSLELHGVLFIRKGIPLTLENYLAVEIEDCMASAGLWKRSEYGGKI